MAPRRIVPGRIITPATPRPERAADRSAPREGRGVQRFLKPLLSLLLAPLLPCPAAAFAQRQVSGPATLEVRSDDDRPGIALSDFLRVTVTVEGGKGLEVEVPLRLAEGAA